MRCIEILGCMSYDEYEKQININMRCIEMTQCDNDYENFKLININMRCIEIFQKALGFLVLPD